MVAALRPEDGVDDDVAVVVPTSGSTGTPKGVLLTADALLAVAHAALDRLGGPGRWLLAIPPTHVGGLQVLVRSLRRRARPGRSLPPGPFSRRVARRRRTAAATSRSVPTQLRPRSRRADLAGFDAALLGGAATPAALRRARSATRRDHLRHERDGWRLRLRRRAAGRRRGRRDGPGPAARPGPGARATATAPSCATPTAGSPPATSARSPTGGWSCSAAPTTSSTPAARRSRRPRSRRRSPRTRPSGEVAVAGLPDPEWGQRVVAWVVGDGHARAGPRAGRRAARPGGRAP